MAHLRVVEAETPDNSMAADLHPGKTSGDSRGLHWEEAKIPTMEDECAFTTQHAHWE